MCRTDDHPVEPRFCATWPARIVGNLCNYRADARPIRSVPSRKSIDGAAAGRREGEDWESKRSAAIRQLGSSRCERCRETSNDDEKFNYPPRKIEERTSRRR